MNAETVQLMFQMTLLYGLLDCYVAQYAINKYAIGFANVYSSHNADKVPLFLLRLILFIP